MRHLILLVVVGVGCASQPKPMLKAEEVFVPSGGPPVTSAEQSRELLGTPKAWASQFRRDIDCAQSARTLKIQVGAEQAWRYMKACAEKQGFTQLELFCSDWTDFLRDDPAAPSLIAQTIANRGGHVERDLEVVRKHRVALFGLPTAVRQPAAFKGRYLVFVGKIAELKDKRGKAEAVVLEQSLSSELSLVMTGPMRGGRGSAKWGSSGALGSGSASYGSVSGDVEQRQTDSFEETGQEVVLKLRQLDPYLTVDKNLLFLVRFDNAVIGDTADLSDGEEPTRTGVVTLISYHEL
ncbi:MAG: hypothetical protein ACOZQL_14475 [Myxococcota bacterium]